VGEVRDGFAHLLPALRRASRSEWARAAGANQPRKGGFSFSPRHG